MHNDLFSIGPVTVHGYGLMIAVGILAAWLTAEYRGKRRGLNTDRIWGLDSEAEYNNLEVYVSFLRKKLSFLGAGTAIRTSRGLGYSLEKD